MTALQLPSPLVSVDWLAAHLSDPRLVVLDAHMAPPGSAPASGPVMQILGARRFDFDSEICDQRSPLPHMLPSAAQFTAQVQALGINGDSLIVVYDRLGIFSAPRALWMWRAMGHGAVAILDGGLPAWQAAGQPLEEACPYAGPAGDFVAAPVADLFCDGDEVAARLADGSRPVVDARARERFAGQVAEPRPGLRSGHMPGALNLPYAELLRDGRFKPIDELQNALGTLLPADSAPLLTCGSGVTACVLAVAAELAGYRGMTIYDGSWADWGSDPNRLVVSDN
ncbi:MAG: sulfurtransferase [Gammaproteobacteria bacterium]|nr:sulfurtransferase [Gammaproteobacteria bacterium]